MLTEQLGITDTLKTKLGLLNILSKIIENLHFTDNLK